MAKAKLSKKYQIVIPKEVRKKMRLEAGAQVAIYPLDETRAMLIKHPQNSVKALRGLGKELWEALGGADKYLKEERASWDKPSA